MFNGFCYISMNNNAGILIGTTLCYLFKKPIFKDEWQMWLLCMIKDENLKIESHDKFKLIACRFTNK